MLSPKRLEVAPLAGSPLPVDLSLIKMHCAIDGSEFDALLSTYLLAAIAWAEGAMHRTIFARSHSWVLNEFPRCHGEEIRLPRGKTQSIEGIDYVQNNEPLGIVKLTDFGRISVTAAIMTLLRDPLYRRHRFAPEVIGYAVWLYFRFPLSLRMVEEMLAARGIDVSHETVRSWAEKFGREYSNRIRRRAPARGDKWHLDEVVITISGRKHWLWRAVDQNGFVLDILVQSRRDRTAARRLMRKLLKKSAKAPRVLITDKLKSYTAARKDMGLRIEHRQHKGLNNRAENSHLPTRRRERMMKRFKSPRHIQRFLSIHDQIANLFHFPRNNLSAIDHRAARAKAFSAWAEIAAAPLAA